MKSLLLFIGLFLVSTVICAQENLVKDGKFENSSFSVNDIIRKQPGEGLWYPYLTSDRQAVLTVKNDDEKGKVASIQTLSGPSYAYSFIGQKIKDTPKAAVYQVSFYAKAASSSAAVIAVYLHINAGDGNLYFPINNFNPDETPTSSGALKQIRLTDDWNLYTIEFDLSKAINTVSNQNNAKAMEIEKSLSADRKDFDLKIACLSKNSGLLFTDVTFTKL